jgi:hypothetical protein
MAIKADIKKAQQKAAEEAARAAAMGNFGPMPFLKLKSGKNRIRVMPPWTDEGKNAYQWWREVWTHWGVGPDDENKKTVACPKKTPQLDGAATDCPVCDEVERLRATGDPADLEEAKALRARMRVFVNAIDLEDPEWTQENIDEMIGAGVEEDRLPEVGDPKIQVLGFGSMIFKELLDYYNDEIDMTDLEEGYNVIITKEGKDLNTKYRVRLEKNISQAPVPDDDPKLHNLDMVQQVKSAAEIMAIMEGVDPDEAKKLAAKASAAAKKKTPKKLPPKAKEEEEEETPTEEEEEETPTEEEQAEEEGGEEEQEEGGEEEQEAQGGNGVSKDWPPVDDDGYLDFDRISDEQIEDPANVSVQDAHGTSVHIGCYGAAKQHDKDDSTCQECPLFDRCGKRVAALEAAKAKKAPGKKAPGKSKAPGKPKPGGKAAGKSAADSLMEEMEQATGKRK